MNNYRLYGKAPFHVAVIHGGPGAKGEMKPVAEELSKDYGIIEPLQTTFSLEEQVCELHSTLKNYSDIPIILIGWSWGAILSYIFTARYPGFVKKLILIGSAEFEEKYAKNIMQTRMNRLNDNDQKKINNLINQLQNPNMSSLIKNTLFKKLGKLIYKADSYNPLPFEEEIIECQYEIYHNVWNDAKKFRKEGKLLRLGKQIHCPVFAIHGDYDPHPFIGIKKSLSKVLCNFKTFLLPKCGHHPWREKNANIFFYKILKSIIMN